MESVFLSYSFRETPRAFKSAISSVLEDHEIRPQWLHVELTDGGLP